MAVRRIKKRFVTLIYGTILGFAFLLMGDWLFLFFFAAIGLLCELILWKEGSYNNPRRITAA